MTTYAFDQPTATHKANYWEFPIMQRRVLTIDDVIDATCNVFSISRLNLLSKQRNRDFVKARYVCMYVIKQKLNTSLKKIGEAFSGRDHTTVIHAISSIESDLTV